MSTFPLSPGITIREIDNTTITPAVATSPGAVVGVFPWGPVLEPITIPSENVLVERFGRPNDNNVMSFFTAANFLSYTNNCLVVRAETAGLKNAVATATGGVTSVNITNAGTGYTAATVTFGTPNVTGGVQATGTVVVSGGEVIEIVITNPGTGYTSAPSVTIAGDGADAAGTAVITTGGILIKNTEEYLAQYVNGAGVVGEFAAKYPGDLGNSIRVEIADVDSFAGWDYEDEFDSTPGTSPAVLSAGGADDEVHVIVIDELGVWTGTAGSILEKFSFLSKASGVRRFDGSNNYYKDVINSRSRYVWWMDHPTGMTNWGEDATETFDTLNSPVSTELTGGIDDYDATDGNLQNAWVLLANDELYDIALLPLGHASTVVANFVIAEVAEVRKDCMVFISPNDDGDIILGSGSDAVNAILAYRNQLPSTSFAVMDTGYKYQYDRYNDKYRYIPLNADVAGLCARTDMTNAAWFSPGGYNRGQIKNVVRLAVNTGKTERDNLYKSGVNPIVSFPGEGTILYGDRTLLATPSAFDRINVRRLFIVLEKAIARAAKSQLFEFNDAFTRAQFRSIVEPFLRDVQGRSGITDFRVICDETNNTTDVIDRNEFRADIYVKPNRSINFITLTFVAARSSLNFTEIGG